MYIVKSDKQYSIIDLFSGAGGLSEGFISNGFVPVAHVEMDQDAANTVRTRIAYHYLNDIGRINLYNEYLKGYVAMNEFHSFIPKQYIDTMIREKLNEETFESICERIDKNKAELGVEKIDVLVGGPPCQTFSVISRRKEKQPFDNANDLRNRLYALYARMLTRYEPKYFVFENVPGFKTARGGDFFKAFQNHVLDAGYLMKADLMDSSEYGVIQKRTRLIITGWKKDLPGDRINYPKRSFEHKNVWDALSDLHPLEPGDENNSYYKEGSDFLYKSGIRKKNDIIDLTLHLSRYHNNNDRKIYEIAIQLWNEKKTRLRYPDLDASLITRSKTDAFFDKYKVVAGDLPYSHTIIAHIAKDGHYYIHPDIEQKRSLSVREAARIQSFPDNYYFEGSRLRKYMQIGNAVPPLMAEQIARGIKEVL